MKVIIAGSRSIRDSNVVKLAIESAGYSSITEIISGGAIGVDTLAENYAKEHGIPISYFWPDWNSFGKAAGPIRNRVMSYYGDALIAIWDGISPGTKSMIEAMHYLDKPIAIYEYR